MKDSNGMLSIAVFGGAVGDIVLSIPNLPNRGGDIEGDFIGEQIGGCALNVIKVLSKLNVPIINGVIVGNGRFGRQIENFMQSINLSVNLRYPLQDNGWCIALTEPDGERTFISVTGCENKWNIDELNKLEIHNEDIIYASGYELLGEKGGILGQWLIKQSNLKVIDFGPRISSIDLNFIRSLDPQNTILTLNQDELIILCGEQKDPMDAAIHFVEKTGISLIYRLGKEGAYIISAHCDPKYVPAYPVKVVDSIGAGDSHCAGVLLGLSLGYDLLKSVDLGNKIASYIVGQRGTDMTPNWQQIQQITRKI